MIIKSKPIKYFIGIVDAVTIQNSLGSANRSPYKRSANWEQSTSTGLGNSFADNWLFDPYKE